MINHKFNNIFNSYIIFGRTQEKLIALLLKNMIIKVTFHFIFYSSMYSELVN